MGKSAPVEVPVRLLPLGNEILADDAFGIHVASEVERRLGNVIDVIASSESGFNLLDHLLDVAHLVVVDTIQTGSASPGTIHHIEADQVHPALASSPHSLGLFELLAWARELRLPVPRRVSIVAAEAADCLTVGGSIHADVAAAIPRAVDCILDLSDAP